ncbi:MAG: radical SAM protein [Elusimicrobiota bacterium]
MVKVKPNANFYSLGGSSVHESKSGEYIEYRRKWEENPKNFILNDFPIDLDIESTSRCNLRCTFCDKLPLMSKDQFGDMNYEMYTKIIDEGREYGLAAVKLSYRGEPLLHPKISEMVHYAKKCGVIDVYFNTNAMLLTENMIQKLVDAGLDRISVSIEGTDAEKFEKNRKGAKLSVIKKNLEALLEIRKQGGLNYPKVRIQTIFSLEDDTDKYVKTWRPFCDEVAAVDYKDESKREKGIVYDWACPQLWQRMTIEWDGTILPCNNDDLRTISPGNVKKNTIFECWHDERLNTARELHKSGRSDEVEDCDGCPWRTAQISKLTK